jgi:hypothetical protein
MIVRGAIACSGDIIVQGTQRAIAEVAANIDSQPCGQPLCYRTDVLDHRIEVYNGRAGAGMGKVQGTSGACIEFDDARFRLSSCEGKAKDDFRACQGFEGLEVLIEDCMGGDHQIWLCPTPGARGFPGLAKMSCSSKAARQEPGGQTGAGLRAQRVKGWQDAARALEAQARRPAPTHAAHASDCARASQGAR